MKTEFIEHIVYEYNEDYRDWEWIDGFEDYDNVASEAIHCAIYDKVIKTLNPKDGQQVIFDIKVTFEVIDEKHSE